MSTTFLDIPAIIVDIISRMVTDYEPRVVENMSDIAAEAPTIAVKGDDPEVEGLGLGLDQYNTPVRIGCWHTTDADADILRKEIVTIFATKANAVDPKDKDANAYGVKHIAITGFGSEDVNTKRGDRYCRVLELDVLWYFEY